jgi:hypothetical protein
MERHKERLLQHQETQMMCFEQHCWDDVEDIKRQQDEKVGSVVARQTKLGYEINDWSVSPPTTLPPSAAPIPDLVHQPPMTPRTAKRYSQFKKADTGPQISILPLGKVKPVRRQSPKMLTTSRKKSS